MVLTRLLGLIRGDGGQSSRKWQHLAEPTWPPAIYAVGDIHGCIDQLIDLEAKICADATSYEGDCWIVYLGDLLDRGPDSAAVLDRLIDPPPAGIRRICLAGNHEAMALEFFNAPRTNAHWLQFGGDTTLASYGIQQSAWAGASARALRDIVRSHIPREHLDFLRNLHLTLSVPGNVFVHAGLRPGIAPDQQAESDLLWIRGDFFDAPLTPGLRVIHGHTPGPAVVQAEGRVCVDTGAFATGILSAVRLTPDGAINIFQSSISPASGPQG